MAAKTPVKAAIEATYESYQRLRDQEEMRDLAAEMPAVSRRTRIERTDWTLCVERAGRAAPMIMVEPSGREVIRYKPWESRFDVFIRHVDGTRIPMGRNLFADPSAEESRLLALVDPPDFIGPYHRTDDGGAA